MSFLAVIRISILSLEIVEVMKADVWDVGNVFLQSLAQAAYIPCDLVVEVIW